MSKDIRSFFTVKSASSNLKKTSLKETKLGQKRKPVTVIESDSDEDCVSSPIKRSKLSNGIGKSPTASSKKSTSNHKTSKSEKNKKNLIVIDSDSDEDVIFTSTKRNKLSNVVEKKPSPLKKESHNKVSSKYFKGESVSANNIFSAKPIKRDNSRNIVKVTVQKEAEDFDIDKDFESELLRLEEVVEKEFQSQNHEDSKCNEAKSKDESREILEKSSLEPEEEIECLPKIIDNTCKSAQESESPKRELKRNIKSPESQKCNKISKISTLSFYNKTDNNSKITTSQSEAKSPQQSPAKEVLRQGLRERRTPSKVLETSPLKDLDNKRTRKTPSKIPVSSSPIDLNNSRTRTPSKISVASPSNSKTLDSPVIPEKLKKSTKTPLFTNQTEKCIDVIVSLQENKSSNDPKKIFDSSHSNLWVEKYKPTTTKQIIGQQGDKSCVNKLITWLKSWYRNQSGNKKLTKPSPWAKNDDGGYFKAALLSGPPGVGKTTTAHLVTRELGFDVVEFNASDTRSKKLLHQEVSELLSTNSLSPFVTGKGEHVSKKHVLLMDEVDGMAGNEDRGGVQELIQLIKQSRVPIICMCNDRNHPKIRSLANYCFDLRFSKPRVEQIKGAMMSMCFKEKLKLAPNTIADIITSANQDIRLVINHLSMLAVEDSKLTNSTKHIKMGPWDITRKIFSEEEHKSMSIYDKCDLFFHDYSVTPLFVQENYLNAVPHKPEAKNKIKKMELFAAAAKSLSLGDLTEKSIRSHNAWGLLPVQAIFSSLVPGDILEGHIGAQINFPGWFGKNSRTTKMSRLLQELTVHSRLKISGNKEAMNLDYVAPLESSIVSPLIKEGADGITQALEVLSEYCLVREDLESLGELTSWPNTQNRFSQVESKVKAAFTRAYNKTSAPTPYAAVPIKKGSKAEVDFTDSIPDEEEEGVSQTAEDDEEDTAEVDAMIVIKKKQPAKKTEKEAAQLTSKGAKSSKRGRKK